MVSAVPAAFLETMNVHHLSTFSLLLGVAAGKYLPDPPIPHFCRHNQGSCLGKLRYYHQTLTTVKPLAFLFFKSLKFRGSHRGTVEPNLTRNHEVAGSIPGLSQWVKDPALP